MNACTLSKRCRSVTSGLTVALVMSAVSSQAQSASQQEVANANSAARRSVAPISTELASTSLSMNPLPDASSAQFEASTQATLIHAQAPMFALARAADLPDAPVPAGYLEQVATASVVGSVVDANGRQVGGARATLQNVGSQAVQVVIADDTGIFRFDTLVPSAWTLTISAPGFADWVAKPVTTVQGTATEVKNIVLHLQGMSTTVDVRLNQHEIAEEQLKDQEKQRLLGIVPNFYVSYVSNPAPLSAGQKLKLAARTMYDPAIFVGAGVRAGIQQARNTYPSLGEGPEGYGERFGIAYGSRASSFFLGRAVFPVLFRQDPRYFYQGTGTVKSRAFHAISSPFYCRSDRGPYQPCYSNVLGTIAAAELSNSFIPAADRNGARDVFTDALLNTLGSAGRALLQEFVFPKITRGRKRASAASAPKP
jgi:hypothetical protein